MSTTSVDPRGAASESRTETWQRNTPPYDGRQLAGERELALADGRPQAYDARTNTILTVAPGAKLPPAESLRLDVGESGLVDRVRRLLASGEAREDARTTVGGREAITIVATNLTLLVDARTFAPIEWRIVADDGTREISRFERYEVLPATSANLALLDLRAQHPDARVRPGGVTVDGF